MTRSLGSEPRSIGPTDERPHEHGGEQGWIERLGFNFFDGASGYGGLATLEYRPGDRRASGELDIFLPGGGVATSLARTNDAKRADGTVGRLSFELVEEMKSWRVRCTDVALVFPSAESASLAAKTERAGKASPLEIDITFDALTEVVGWGARKTEVNTEGFTGIVSQGSFEQAGRYTGHVRIGQESTELHAHGFRARTWGVPGEGGFWYAAVFAEDLAVSMGRVVLDDRSVTHGRVYRAGRVFDWKGQGRQSLTSGRLDIMLDDVGGQDIHVTGDVLGTIPPRAGEPDLYRSVARFHMGARDTTGFIETSVLSL